MITIIRPLEEKDCAEILNIYAHYIKTTSYTFEIDVPTLEEFKTRIMSIAKDFPFFVYEKEGKVLGYCYASAHNQRQAYRFSVNVSIYVDNAHMTKGIGTKLYDKLLASLKDKGYYNAFSCITIPNAPSISMHEKYDFQEVGRFKNAGYKFNEWHDILWMQKELKPADF